MRQTMQMVMEAVEQFTITQTDSTTVFGYANARTFIYYTDGRKTKQELDDGGSIETKANWDNERLVVERKIDGAGKVVEEYSLAPEGEQLYVVVRAELGRMGKIEFRRIYDPLSRS